MLRRPLNDLLGLFAREPLFALEILAEPPRADREVTGQHGDAIFEDVHVGHFVTDVDQSHDALHRVGVVQLEGVVDRERIDVDDGGIEPGLG